MPNSWQRHLNWCCRQTMRRMMALATMLKMMTPHSTLPPNPQHRCHCLLLWILRWLRRRFLWQIQRWLRHHQSRTRLNDAINDAEIYADVLNDTAIALPPMTTTLHSMMRSLTSTPTTTSDDGKIHDGRSNKCVINDKEILDNKPFCFCRSSSVPPNNSIYN